MSIQVSGLYKHFGQFTALNNVSIEFPSGGTRGTALLFRLW